MKRIIILTIIIILLIIGGTTAYKVINKHHQELMLVSTKRIEEAALKCYNEKRCTDTKITLSLLYELKYLNREADPITKEYYNEDSYIEIKEGIAIFTDIS